MHAIKSALREKLNILGHYGDTLCIDSTQEVSILEKTNKAKSIDDDCSV
jgi:hypothetical protein